MTNVDAILGLIRSEPGLTDQQLRDRLGLKHVAQVNQICRRLEAHGHIRRSPGPHGRLINAPGGVNATPSRGESAHSGTALPRDAAASAGQPAVVDAWRRFAQLDPARALLVLPCSAAKRSGGAATEGMDIADALPESLRERLAKARQAAAAKAKLDASTLRPAWRRYRGAFYEAAGPVLEAALRDHAHILILSGGYGIVLAAQPIGSYGARLHPGWWPDHLLQRCLVAYASRYGLFAVVAFAGSSTPYAHIIRSTAWGANGVDRAYLLSPEFGGKGGAMGVVPGALGEAFAAVWSRTIVAGWTSTKGLCIAIEELS